MTEAVFPLVGTALVVLVVLPAFAALAKLLLWALERRHALGTLHGLDVRYLVLSGSSLLPLAWILSAALHQAETGRSVVACLFDHDSASPCFEAGFFTATLSLVIAGLCVRGLDAAPRIDVSSSPRARAFSSIVEGLIRSHPSLHGLADRIAITEVPGIAVETRGWWRPRILLGLAYAEGLRPEALASALAHEAEHVRASDPLRYFVLSFALAVNPFGRWLLSADAARWIAAREAHCDREAVLRGAAPLPLAEAIVRAARPTSRDVVALASADAAVLRFRVDLLLAFSERPPVQCCHRRGGGVWGASALLVVAMFLPHQTGTHALDALHTSAEHALTFFLR